MRELRDRSACGRHVNMELANLQALKAEKVLKTPWHNSSRGAAVVLNQVGGQFTRAGEL